MPSYEFLVDVAKEAALQSQSRITGLEEEKLRLQDQIAEIDLSLKASQSAKDRLLAFEQSIGGQIQCPKCWVLRGVRAEVIPVTVAEPAPRTDYFRCRVCRSDFEYTPSA